VLLSWGAIENQGIDALNSLFGPRTNCHFLIGSSGVEIDSTNQLAQKDIQPFNQYIPFGFSKLQLTRRALNLIVMSGRVKLNITGSTETLKTLLGQQNAASGKEKIASTVTQKLSETVQHLAVVLGRITVQGG